MIERENKSTNLTEIFPTVRAHYGAEWNDGYGKIVSVDNEFATIEWEQEYSDAIEWEKNHPNEDVPPAWTEKVELSSIHEDGWTDYYGSSIGIFYEREENE